MPVYFLRRDIKGAHIEERNMWSISEELREVKLKSECTVLNCILTKQNTCLKNSAFNKNYKSESVKIKHYFGWQFLFHFFQLVWGCLKEYTQNTESLLESEPENIIYWILRQSWKQNFNETKSGGEGCPQGASPNAYLMKRVTLKVFSQEHSKLENCIKTR